MVNSKETDYPILDKIKADFDKAYENERKKKEFDKYYMLNKYAKQKKRRRNFSIDRRHHYDKILEESSETKGSGWLKQLALIGVLCAIVILAFQVKHKMNEGPINIVESLAGSHEEGGALKEKTKKKKK